MSLSENLKHIFRALKHRNYRLYFTGQSISLIGTWMQQMAIGWLIYRITNSAFMLGLVGFLSQIPTLILTPLAGVLADRYNRHRILIATQVLAMIQALALAFLIMSKTVSVWQIIALSMFLGIIGAFDAPARHAFIVEMVNKREDLSNAIALNSLIFNAARLIGPSIAGILVAVVGEGMCFFINGISYIAVIAALLSMRLAPLKIEKHHKHIMQGLKEGFSYVSGSAQIRAILFLTGLVSLMGMSYVVLMPIFAKDILHGGPSTLGFLMASSGLGALIGATYLASRKDVRGLEKIIFFTTNVFGISLIAFSFSRTLWISMLILSFTGFGMMIQMASNNTVLQTIIRDDMRGRVMSFFLVAFMGMVPFGCLLSGSLASRIGAPGALIICGASSVIGSFLFRVKEIVMKEKI